MFRAVPTEADFPALETDELARWCEHHVFERSLALREGGPRWVFYEGPPTANGRPGLHHVWARVFKDLFCRYRTMRGFTVARKAGWDTHGLPVEVEVEKRLGITAKRQIEELGIAEFTRLCKESVRSYVDDWRALTDRIGFWIDSDAAYWTFTSDYVESVWWHLRQLWDQGLLYEDVKVIPYCPRCGTALSSHELGQPEVYREVEDESAYVRLPLTDEGEPAARLRTLLGADSLAGLSLVVWTTTPWTLLSNTGAAVHPDLTYVVADGLIVAEDLLEEALRGGTAGGGTAGGGRQGDAGGTGQDGGADAAVEGEDAVAPGISPAAGLPLLRGSDLVGLHYARPFDDVDLPPGTAEGDAFRVVAGAFVTTDEGTGVVHLAPAFGEIDRQVGRANGLPVVNPVGADGCFTDAVPWLAGRPVREVNAEVNDRLSAAGLLVRRQPYVHAYPHCWRCSTPLIYWGKPSWYVATSTRKDELVTQNQGIDWHPAHIRDGRFGEWLANNIDWALSRDRYWGTPLPIWQCPERHTFCVGSLAELSDLAGRDVTGIDPHRPTIDDVTFDCPECAASTSAVARRVEPVIDAWFDSGSMPAAQWGYPHVPGSEERYVAPADFICEAIDQTRGWFYSLLTVNTLVFGATPYKHVLCLGHIVDAEGRKMSKSVGNVIDPWEIITTRGVDPLRWWMCSQGSPWTPTRVSFDAIDTSTRDILLTLWNTWSFFATYASLNGFDPADPQVPPATARPLLDRWARSRLHATVAEVTEALDRYEPHVAASLVARLVDDVSNWYVRRSRRRFWRTDPGVDATDGLAAQATLHEILVTVSLLLAPMCPFLADRMWRELTDAAPDASVHLADWPEADLAAFDAELEASMDLARRLASLGRAARAEARVKVRQPLARALVFLPPGSPELPPGIVEDELNVDEVVRTTELADVLTYELVPNFRVLGPKLGERVQELRAALGAIDGAKAAAEMAEGRPVVVELASGPVELGPDELELRVRGQEGYAVGREGGEVAALDLTLTDDLLRRGLAREVVRHVQDLRKATGLEVSDWIVLHVVGLDVLAPLFDQIGREVLAREVVTSPPAGEVEGTVLDLGAEGGDLGVGEVWAWVVKA